MAADVDTDTTNNLEIMYFPIVINLLMSIGAYFITVRLIPGIKDKFIKANLFGIDMSKTTSDKV